MEVSGIIHSIGSVQQVSEKFKKQEVIVKTEASSQYPQHIKIQFSQDKCSLTDALRAGQECKFHLNLRGKLYTGKDGVENAITNLECWKVEVLGGAPVASNPLPPSEADDLPF